MCCRVLFYIHDRNLALSIKFEKQQVCTTNKVIVVSDVDDYDDNNDDDNDDDAGEQVADVSDDQ